MFHVFHILQLLTLRFKKKNNNFLIVYLRKLAQQENQPRAPVHNVDLDNMSYEQILQLQVIFFKIYIFSMCFLRLFFFKEQIGDVKQESWSQRAKQVIQERCEVGTMEAFQKKGHCSDQCLICQHQYHPGIFLCFH